MKSLNDLVNDFSKATAATQKVIDAAPRTFGVIAVQAIRDNFRLQGYDDGNTVTKWDPRKEATNRAYSRGRGKGGRSRYKGSVFNAANPILQQTRNLYNAVKADVMGKKVFTGVNLSLVPYALAHNEGLNHQPKRQYMPLPNEGPNKKMITAFKVKYQSQLDEAMKDFKRKGFLNRIRR